MIRDGGCRELAITYHLRQLIRKGEGPEAEGKRTRRDEPWQPKLPGALGLGWGQPDEGKPDPTDKTRHASQKDCPVVLFGNGVELFEHAHAQEAQGEEREFSAAGLLPPLAQDERHDDRRKSAQRLHRGTQRTLDPLAAGTHTLDPPSPRTRPRGYH